jgi:hypothetical protein
MIENVKKYKFEIFIILLVITLVTFFLSYGTNPVNGGVGNNTSVYTKLDVGNVYPEVLNVSIENNTNDLILIPNSSKLVTCEALLRDYNNETDIQQVTAEFYNSSYGGSDDNNYHYTNASCFINRTFVNWRGVLDDIYLAIASCTFNVWYYARPGIWNCTVFVNDSINWNASNSDTILLQELMAVNLPDQIDYGTVNATYVSLERIANVSNAGNVRINLSLDGYAVRRYDNLSMNCSLGTIKNISIMHEKYNLTAPTPGILSLTSAADYYTNLTSNATIKRFELSSRQNDNFDDAINSTYWRIYVPIGVAGTCGGNIVFGATQAAGN